MKIKIENREIDTNNKEQMDLLLTCVTETIERNKEAQEIKDIRWFAQKIVEQKRSEEIHGDEWHGPFSNRLDDDTKLRLVTEIVDIELEDKKLSLQEIARLKAAQVNQR